MTDSHVLRVNSVEEETAFRNSVRETLDLIIADRPGRTLIDIAEAIDVSVKTISNAFNKTHSLSETFLRRLGRKFGPDKLDPWAKLTGARMAPLESAAVADILPLVGRVALAIAEARHPASPGGVREIHTERLGYLANLRALQRDLNALICDIEATRDAA